MKTLLLSLALLTTLLATPKENEVKNAMTTFKSTLQKNLKQAIKNVGILHAAHFCNAHALSLTEDISRDLGSNVSIKRISLKPRNPLNKADEAETNVLNTFLATHSKEMVKHQINETTTRYYKPMYISKPICLKCHGVIEATSPMGSFLAEHYPDDKATNYKMGDFRGAMVIDIIR